MFEDLNWVSVAIYIGGCLGSAFIAIAGFMFTRGIREGRLQQRMDYAEERLNISNGERQKMTKAESALCAEIESLKGQLLQREDRWNRNNTDHIEIFARINALEKGQAALPGQFADMMEKRAEKWFRQWRDTVRSDVYDILRQVDDERMKYRRRETDKSVGTDDTE